MGPSLFPVALDLRGRRCVVVGGGPVGARRMTALLESHALVIVIAPEAVEEIHRLAAAERIQYLPETFAPEHLDAAFLVVAATDSAPVNAAVAEAARARNILLNLAASADDSESGAFGDFVVMASVRRGDLLLALTTGGAGPAVTARLRRDLETQMGTEYAEWLSLLHEMRMLAKTQISDTATRTAALRRLAYADSVREKLKAGDKIGAREEALACLS